MASMWRQQGKYNETRFEGFAMRWGKGLILMPNDTVHNIERYTDKNGPSNVPVTFDYPIHPDSQTKDHMLLERLADPTNPYQPRLQQPVHNVTDVITGYNPDHKHGEPWLTDDHKLKEFKKLGNTSFSLYEVVDNPKRGFFSLKDPPTGKNVPLPANTEWPKYVEKDPKQHGKDCHLVTYSSHPRQSSRQSSLERETKRTLVTIPIQDVYPRDCKEGQCNLRTKHNNDVICHSDRGAVVHCKNNNDRHYATHIVSGRKGKTCTREFKTAHLAYF